MKPEIPALLEADPRAGPPDLIGCGAAGPVPPPEAIGFKAHNLARMAELGLPVPAAFVIGTAWCSRPRAVKATLWQNALPIPA